MLPRALLCDVSHYLVLVVAPGPAIKMPVLRYCVAVRECSQHVVFIKGIDVGRVQMPFVKSLGTSSPSTVHLIGALPGEIWERKAHVFQLFPVQTIGFSDKVNTLISRRIERFVFYLEMHGCANTTATINLLPNSNWTGLLSIVFFQFH